jgi:hypothetical protein
MKDYVLKISLSEKFKNPAEVLDMLFEGSLHYYSKGDAGKLIGWSSLETTDGQVLAKRTIIDWGE